MGAGTLRSASVIRTVQRGSVSLPPGGSSSVTVDYVDITKSILVMSCANGYAADTNNYGAASSVVIGGKITNNTSLDFYCGDGSPNYIGQTANAVAYWELVEYE